MPKKHLHFERNFESLKADPRAVAMIPERRTILNEITGSNGLVVRAKAREIGASFASPLAAETVMRFAAGETRNPSGWTIKYLAEYVKGKPKRYVLIDEDYILPPEAGEVKVE